MNPNSRPPFHLGYHFFSYLPFATPYPPKHGVFLLKNFHFDTHPTPPLTLHLEPKPRMSTIVSILINDVEMFSS